MHITTDQEWIDYVTRPARILLVEDDEYVISTFASFANLFNCEMDVARSGNEALDFYEPGKYTIVFLDMVLPGMSGVEVFRRIQEIDETVSVVVITGFLNDALIDEVYRIGPVSFVRKPLDFNLRFLIRMFGQYRIRRKENTSPFP